MQRIGRYEVLAELGHGSMGAVYKCRDAQIDRIVAIKIIPTANLSSQELEQYKQRFQREAQAAGRMSHPGIVTIHDIAEDESGQPYLVMEYVEGTPLDRLLVPGAERLPLAETIEIGIQVARALEYAHRHGVVHRDIKPANILVTPDGRAKIADFGIAKLAGTQLTQAGQLLGTPAFMSPEQFSGAAVDARSDLFSLGATLYWMCTGEKPFAGDTITAVSFKIVYTTPIPARQLNAALPADLDAVLARCMAKSPADRYPACADLAADLEAIKSGRPVTAKPIPAMPLDRTVVMPAMSTVVMGAAPRVEESAVRQETALSPSAKPRRRWVRLLYRPVTAMWGVARKRPQRALAAVGVALLLVLFGWGYWLWSGQAAGPGAADAGSSSPRSVLAARSARRVAGRWPRSEGAGSDGATSPVASATLRIVCEHNFHSATLEVFADDQRLLETGLRGHEQDFGVVHVFQGQMETSTPIAAGRHVVRVHVRAPEDDYEDEAEISGTFSEGSVRTLLIQFGKGSALGVTERRLTLSWR